MTEEDWTPRTDVWLISLHATQRDVTMPGPQTYQRWLDELRKVIGSGPQASLYNRENGLPWALGDPPVHGYWWTDHWGFRHWRTDPWAIIWQQISGVPTVAMALCHVAIHFVQPLTEAGYQAHDITVELADEAPVAI